MNSFTYTVLHLFSGLGGAALGMQNAETEYRGVRANFLTLGGIDCDPDACTDFEMFTGVPAFNMDLFSREDYIAFHGTEPPTIWREVTPQALFFDRVNHLIYDDDTWTDEEQKYDPEVA